MKLKDQYASMVIYGNFNLQGLFKKALYISGTCTFQACVN